jgi:type IV pilus assembly protein PilB
MAEAISHPLIALIRERGLLDALQIEEIGQEVQRSGKSVVQILQDYGLLDLDSILQIMADHLGTMVVTLEPDTIPPEAIAAVSNETARMYQVVPMALYGDTLQIVLADPLNPQTLDELGFALKYTLQVVVANPADVSACIEKFYPAQADLGYAALIKELGGDGDVSKEQK